MFRVSTFDPDHIPRNEDGTVNYKEDFFGKATNLTVSGQLEGELAAMAIARQLSVREIEKLVRQGSAPEKGRERSARQSDPAKDADIAAVQRHLEEFLGLPVKISTDADPRSGAVTVRYATLDQLDLICQRLTGGAI